MRARFVGAPRLALLGRGDCPPSSPFIRGLAAALAAGGSPNHGIEKLGVANVRLTAFQEGAAFSSILERELQRRRDLSRE
jgi:hypothetical protein